MDRYDGWVAESSDRLRRFARYLSPRHRRWRRLIDSLDFDPDQVDRVEPPDPRDFIICGCSRTGTSLLAAALFQPPEVVTVMEPWDGLRLPPAELFASLRNEILKGHRLARGRLDIGALEETRRMRWVRDGEAPRELNVEGSFLLGVKWPIFWRYLEFLPETKFLVCLRSPVETIASFKKAGGRLAEGLDYQSALHRPVNEDLLARAPDDAALRRVLLYEYVHQRILPYLGRPNVHVVRYERWFGDPDVVLAEVGDFLGVDSLTLPVDILAAAPSQLDERDRELLGKHCSTAAELGYEL